MDRGVAAAVRPLPESDRKDLAIQALAGSETVSDLAARHGMSRKFVYQQTHKARTALDEAFSPSVRDDEVLFELVVTKTWLRQVIVGLTLICRSSYRGVVEFLRDLLGEPVSLGCVHDVLQAATRQASAVNAEPDLSGIRVGLHDEIFQGATPVLAGVDAHSTYCYLLAAEQHRDADTWSVHLLDAAGQGLAPPPRRLIPRPAAVLPEPPPLCAQPACRAAGQKPAGADDRPGPSTLAHPTGPGTASAPTGVTLGRPAASRTRRIACRNPALTGRRSSR